MEGNKREKEGAGTNNMHSMWGCLYCVSNFVLSYHNS